MKVSHESGVTAGKIVIRLRFAQPDGRADDQDIRRLNLLVQFRPDVGNSGRFSRFAEIVK